MYSLALQMKMLATSTSRLYTGEAMASFDLQQITNQFNCKFISNHPFGRDMGACLLAYNKHN